jgi:hypothetical protein
MMVAIVHRASPSTPVSARARDTLGHLVDPTRRTRRALLLLAPVLLVAVAAAIVTVSSRGDAAFVFEQQHPRTVIPSELETLVAKAPQPTPSGPGAPAGEVRCVPGSAARERNPWHCTVRYPSGDTIRYRVKVRPDGSYTGSDPTGQFLVRGCCVATPSEG